jgi:hypothetical protein
MLKEGFLAQRYEVLREANENFGLSIFNLG